MTNFDPKRKRTNKKQQEPQEKTRNKQDTNQRKQETHKKQTGENMRKKKERERVRESKRERERERKRKKEKERERKRKKEKERERKRKKEKEKERERDTREREKEREREREKEREREREKEWFGEHLLHPTSSRFPLCLESGCAAMECHGDRLPGRYTGGQRHDVSYDEAREGASRAWRRPADGVSFQKNAGYEDGDTDDVFPQQAAESNGLLFSLDQPVVGYIFEVDAFDSHEHGRSGLDPT